MPDDDNVQTCPLAGISPTRIANWERSGVDAIEADLRNNRGLAYVRRTTRHGGTGLAMGPIQTRNGEGAASRGFLIQIGEMGNEH
jgi:hypothetical protein